MLRGENLFLTYQDGESTVDAVHDVTLTVEDQQFVGVLGPSEFTALSLERVAAGYQRVHLL